MPGLVNNLGIRVPPLRPITKAPIPLSVVRNGVGCGAHATQANIADYANGLLRKTVKKVLFQKSIRPAILQTNWSGTYTVGIFAGHTSPGVSRARFEIVAVPGSTNASPPNPVKVILSQETGLTGTGTTSTPATIYTTELSSTISPDRYSTQYADFTILPDQDYRWTVTLYDGARAFSMCLYELPEDSVNPSTDAGAVDTSLIQVGQAVCDETVSDILTCADKLWRRGGPPLFGASGSTDFSPQILYARTSTTYANTLDQSVTTVSSSSPGYPVRVQNQHSFDSINVPCVFYTRAKMAAGAGSGDIRILDNSGTVLATINVTGTSYTWYTATFSLDGTKSADKIDVQLRGDGANDLHVVCYGAFRHVA